MVDAAVLVTGVLIAGLLVAAVLVTGVLIAGLLIAAVLVTGVLIAGLLVAAVLVTGVVIAGVVVEGLVDAGMVAEFVIPDGVLVAGVVVAGDVVLGIAVEMRVEPPLVAGVADAGRPADSPVTPPADTCAAALSACQSTRLQRKSKHSSRTAPRASRAVFVLLTRSISAPGSIGPKAAPVGNADQTPHDRLSL